MRISIRKLFVLAVVLSAMLFVFACAKEVTQSQSSTSQPEAPQASSTAAPAPVAPAGPQVRPQAAGNPAAEAFLTENIHFAFNSAVLSPEARQILNTKAEYLHANPAVTVTVEGHCDERGTNAYNMVLGERRAVMVKKYLVYQGISTERLETISYGEERPLIIGRTEEAWAKNRRAQFVLN